MKRQNTFVPSREGRLGVRLEYVNERNWTPIPICTFAAGATCEGGSLFSLYFRCGGTGFRCCHSPLHRDQASSSSLAPSK